MRILYVAGADAHFFGLLGALIESFEAAVPGGRLLVCDYGFTPAQRAFLDRRGMRLPRPDTLAPDLHHFYQKAALIDYLAGRESEADAVVWIDSDMVLLNPLLPALSDIVTRMRDEGRELAICQEASVGSIAEFLARLDDPSVTLAPFAEALERAGIPTRCPYLNTGFFVCTEPRLLHDWKRLTFAVTPHLLLEQNMMNVLALRTPSKVLVLPGEVWNAHGAHLDTTGLRHDPDCAYGHLPIKVLHATSATRHHIRKMELRVEVAGQPVVTHFKSFRDPDLQAIHIGFAHRFILRHRAENPLG